MSGTPTPTVAQAASAFDQSLGINVHMGSTSGTYTDVALVESDLAYLGVSNVRDALWDTSGQQQLAAEGIKFDFFIPLTGPFTANLSQFISMLDSFVIAYPGSVIAIEGPNEVNDNPVTYDGGTTLADEAAFQQALYAAVKADPKLDEIPVYNLTLANTVAAQFEELGNLSASADYANSRGYLPDNQTPEYALSVISQFAKIDAPGLPEVITEGGYDTNPAYAYSGVDQTVQAKLTLDELMDAFKDGISKTYLYELFDEGGNNFGVFNADGTPKLVATAIHNLTTILADPGNTSSFTPGSLSYAVPNLPTNGNQLLLEKSSGVFDLVLWAEAIIWNSATESEIVAPTESATVNFGQTEKLVLIFDPLQGTTPIAVYSNAESVQVSLSDHPIIIELPSATPTLAAPAITGDDISSTNALTLTGSALPNSTVILYDGTTLLGPTTANGNGAWSFLTAILANGTHSITALDTDAAGDISQLSAALQLTVGPQPPAAPGLPAPPAAPGMLTVTQINGIYEAVLQRAPTATEVTASMGLDSAAGNAAMIAAIVDSSEAITNVYPILLMFNLAFGHFPSATTLASMVDTGLTLPELAAGIVGSQTFANTYDGGTLINPNSPVTAGIVEALYSQALGHAPTQATLNGWLNSGLTVAQAFQDMVTSQSYFETTQPGIEQYLTTAANNAVGNVNANPSNTAGNLTATQINGIYEAVLQRAPTATEVTASMGLDSAAGNAATVAAIVNSPEAITNVYPILQMFDLAFGYLPSAGTLASMVDSELTLPQLAAAIVGSQTFANTYNGGTLINPNSPVTAGIVEALYSQALGHAPTQATLNGWLNSGLTVAQAFQDMVTSQSYFETTQPGIEQYLTTAANSEAGLTIIDETNATGGLTLGTTTMPLMQTSLTVLGGSGTLAVVAGGAGDTITELNTSTAGGTITANGAGDAINAANGANTITANGAGDHINLGVVSTGTSLTAPQIIHAAGAGDIITFATTAADATAVTWGAGASSTVDGGSSSTGIGVNDTINFGNNTASGSQTVVLTGDQTGATTSGGTSTSGIAMTTLGNVVDSKGDLIVFNNATTELLVRSSAVNVTSANSLAHALDMAASAAAASQSGGAIGAHTGVIDWFQYGGNTYLVEAINAANAAAVHAALTATDEIIKIVGLVNLSGETLAGHALTL